MFGTWEKHDMVGQAALLLYLSVAGQYESRVHGTLARPGHFAHAKHTKFSPTI